MFKAILPSFRKNETTGGRTQDELLDTEKRVPKSNHLQNSIKQMRVEERGRQGSGADQAAGASDSHNIDRIN